MTADRRTADRRISPAIGEHAIQQNVKLRESHARLLAALKVFVAAEEEWAKQKAGMPAGTFDDPLDEAYKLARAAIAKATQS